MKASEKRVLKCKAFGDGCVVSCGDGGDGDESIDGHVCEKEEFPSRSEVKRRVCSEREAQHDHETIPEPISMVNTGNAVIIEQSAIASAKFLISKERETTYSNIPQPALQIHLKTPLKTPVRFLACSSS